MNRTVILIGVIGFVAIVGYLHFVQTDYSPLHQLMSELALGKQGALMLWAFMSFALSVAAVIKLLPHPVLKFLLGLTSVSLASAGIYKLGEATTLHVALVALAFVLLALCLYLTPRLITAFQTPVAMAICWGLGASTALFVALGQGILPIGLAQRLATACLLLWLCWLAIYRPEQNND
jgi:hypothetical protein